MFYDCLFYSQGQKTIYNINRTAKSINKKVHSINYFLYTEFIYNLTTIYRTREQANNKDNQNTGTLTLKTYFYVYTNHQDMNKRNLITNAT